MNELQILHEKLRHHPIMIVDDEPMVLEATKVFLQKFFDEVHTAKDGAEALELFEKIPVDIVVTDIKMPRLDGNRLIAAIREKNKNVYIVTMSGTVNEYTKLQENPNLTFSKPINFEHVKVFLNALADFFA